MADLGMRPSKRLGQHFLIDVNVRDKIIEAAELHPCDPVLEVGPGLGALTVQLLARAGRVLAIERDPVLYRYLRGALGGRIDLVHGDALAVDIESMMKNRDSRACWKVVANLPYQIVSPLMYRLLGSSLVTMIVVTVQLEVAERLLAEPGGKDYGVLSVLAAWRGKVERIAKVSPYVFWPRPGVDSAVVRVRIERPAGPEEVRSFLEVVNAGFSHRRKTLENSLRLSGWLGGDRWAIARALEKAGIVGGRRAEDLGPGEFEALSAAARALGV